MGLVPLPEGGAVDHHDGVLHQGLSPHQLVVAGVVDGVDDPVWATKVKVLNLAGHFALGSGPSSLTARQGDTKW